MVIFAPPAGTFGLASGIWKPPRARILGADPFGHNRAFESGGGGLRVGEAAGFRVGEDVQNLPFPLPSLDLEPEARAEKLLVALVKGRASLAAEAHEGREFLGKDVVLADVEGDLSPAPTVVLVSGRKLPEVAVGDEAELVVVVEDDAPVTRQPEVLEKQVAREDVALGQV